MVTTVKFSQFAQANLSDTSNKVVGTGSGINVISPKVISWTTSTRPLAPFNGLLGYNTTVSQYEYWDSVAVMWIPLASGESGTVSQVNTGTGLTGGPITTAGTISFAAITANSLWANLTAGVAVPTIVPTSTFLISADNLGDLPSIPTAVANLGLTIGVNVEAWNAQLDEIAGNTWPGNTSITTLGTILFGTWNSVPITVAFGGTGNTSFTPWSVICAGTTSTGIFQNVVGVGAVDQVLTSNGAGALPTWKNSEGTGTVNSGLINELAWYAADGAAVSGLATTTNGVLVTSAGGVPSISITLPSGLTIPGYALAGANADITSMTGLTGAISAPTFIKSSAALPLLKFNYTASAVNYLSIFNAITTNGPVLQSDGSDSSVGMVLATKNGDISLVDNTSTIAPALLWSNINDTFKVGFKAGVLSASTTWTLPTADAAGFLISDGSKNLSLNGTPSDITGTVTVNGFSATTINVVRSLVIGKMVFLDIEIQGTSNSTSFTITNLPKAALRFINQPALVTDNGTNFLGLMQIPTGSNTITFLTSITGTTFTALGQKNAFIQTWYESV